MYDGSQRLAEVRFNDGIASVLGWRIKLSVVESPETISGAAAVLEEGTGGVSIVVLFETAAGGHLAIPAAVYAGNRFRMLPLRYPCILEDPADFREDLPPTMSRVPALPSLQLLAGDTAIPAIGIAEAGEWWKTGQHCEWGDIGLEAVESERLRIGFLFPGVREGDVYDATPEWRPSPDQAPKPSMGGKLSFVIERCQFQPGGPRELYHAFLGFRSSKQGAQIKHEFPFSAAAKLIEEKHNRHYWNDAIGYYMLSDGQWEYGQWQAGWVGGGIQSYGLAFSDDPETMARTSRMLDFITGQAQHESGLFWSFGIDGRMDTDMVGMSYGHDWHLVRRSGDVLYFLVKNLDLLRKKGHSVKPAWLEGARRATEALCSIWERHHRFGHFVSQFTGEIRSGDTCSGGIIPAALALASVELEDERLLRIAVESARYLVENYLDRGFTNGGPGEAVQAPDSESAFGLLESLVELWELTGDPRWLFDARAAAELSASWVMAYDFRFPPESTMGRIDARTTGSVWANVQNKHSAPAICTLSGASILKLARSTQDWRYLTLLRDIAHGTTQYLSRADKPIFDLLPGGSCERVNTSDWEGDRIGAGEGFAVDCWCSIATLLTTVELPGIYISADRSQIVALDHVEVERSDSGIMIHNPTQFPAEISVLVDDDRPALGSSFTWGLPRFEVSAGGSRTVRWSEALRHPRAGS